jgi:hypothetical protein
VTLPHQRKLPRVLRGAKRASRFAAVALGFVLLAGIGGVPAVSARVPILGQIYARTFGELLGVATRPPATSQPGTSGTTFLLVRSTPSGAQVQVNDQLVGTTPLTIDLLPGSYRVRISREGYASVSRNVEVSEGPVAVDVLLSLGGSDEPQVTPPPARLSPSPVPPAPRPVRPAAPQLPLAIGAKAPALALKDRLGVLYQFEPDQGRKTALLFVWTLQDPTKQLIRDLDTRVRKSGGQVGGLVVMMGTDRATVRNFLLTWKLKIPLVFGTAQVTTLYHLTPGVNMLYLVSGRGSIEQAQKGTINPAGAIR